MSVIIQDFEWKILCSRWDSNRNWTNRTFSRMIIHCSSHLSAGGIQPNSPCVQRSLSESRWRCRQHGFYAIWLGRRELQWDLFLRDADRRVLQLLVQHSNSKYIQFWPVLLEVLRRTCIDPAKRAAPTDRFAILHEHLRPARAQNESHGLARLYSYITSLIFTAFNFQTSLDL